MAGHRLADVEHRVEVDVHQLAPGLRLELDERRAPLDAGVVEENVDRADFLLDQVDMARHRGLVGDVEGPGMCLVTGVRQFLAGALDLFGIPPVDDDLGAGLGKPAGDGEADAPARSGDEGHAARKVEMRLRHCDVSHFPGPGRRPLS